MPNYDLSAVTSIVDSMRVSTNLDVSEARTPPPSIYTSTDFYEFEKDAIFGREWMALGHQNQIPNPGDYFSVSVAGEPLLVVRDDDGEVRVMSAICQHRGHPIAQRDGEREGNTTRFQCPYHAWTYGLDGGLRSAPDMERTCPLDELRSTVALPSLKVEIFHGFVFANMDPNAAPLAPTLTKLDEEWKAYNVADMVPLATVEQRGLPWNWKIMHENGIEPYHTMYVHKGYHEGNPSHLARFLEWDEDDGVVMHPTYLLEKDGGLNPTGRALFPILKGLDDDQRSRIVYGSVPPTMFFCLMPDKIFTFRIFPETANTMTLLLNFYYPKETVRRPKFEWLHEQQAAATHIFGVQDETTNGAMQQGLRSRFAPRGRYSHLETILPQWNSWLMRRYDRRLSELGVDAPRRSAV